MNKNIALCTTFPNWLEYPQQTIPTWIANLPEDLMFLIQLDPCPQLKETEEWLLPLTAEGRDKETIFISREFSPEQLEFLKRHKLKDEKDYRMDYRRFSFKVFAIHQAMTYALEQNKEYLIWADADIIFKKPINNFEPWLPKDQVASYLGRKDWDHSECGFMIFNLKKGGQEFLNRMISMYINDEVLTLKQWHDSFVFDKIKEEFNKANEKDVFLNITDGIAGRDVFDISTLAEFMEHKKGNRKYKNNSCVDLKNFKVQTKNCVDHSVIQKNIKENLILITTWLDMCKTDNEEIVIANAGPSLNPEEIRPFYDKGIKIVAVKHALEQLLNADIIPWACILLDPREHVKEFVKHPKVNQINWFVASMVNPEVVKLLKEQNCKIYGYHAYVGADEHLILPKDHKLICGGSATCTRGIAVLDWLGFKKFHLFAYDLCSLEKPDLNLTKGEGENVKPVWMEITLNCETANDKEVKRTFWTKGEFLAQVQELRDFFKHSGLENFAVYGDGIIPWVYKNLNLQKIYLTNKKNNLILKATNVNQFIKKI
jgi:hypothetical protein